MRIGADTGGTFTDVVDRRRPDPEGAVDARRSRRARSAPALDGLGVRRRSTCSAHGTTVATNALLERRGARVALVTTAGFADVIEIARQDRPSLYDPWADRPAPLVAAADRLEVAERLGADGAELVAARRRLARRARPTDVEAVAVCLLHADLNAAHEATVARAARGARAST